jgi:hypothetical protein
MLPSTSSERGMGAASSSRWAPLSRSTRTLSPTNVVAQRDEQPDGADGDERGVIDMRIQLAERGIQRGRDHQCKHDRR